MLNELPKIGLGTWEIRKQEVLDKVIESAYKTGYRHIDTANLYMNERQIGKSIKKLGIDRSKLFITSKVFNADFKGKRAYITVKDSLKRLQTSYIDLMLLHVPFAKKEDRINAYKRLMDARNDKLINKIGVSNFSIENLKEIKEATGEYPFCNQIIVAPTVRREKLEAFCKKNKIILVGYSTLRSYFNPNPWYPGSGMNEEQKKYVDSLAKKHKKNVGPILSKWALQNGYYVIPKSTKPERVISNFDLEGFELSASEMTKLNTFNTLEDEKKFLKTFESAATGFQLFVLKFLRRLKIV